MDEVLFQVLAENVGRYLAAADRLGAAQPTPAGIELRRMSAAWRALLRLHRPAGASRRGCRWCRRGSLCTVWRVAAAYFVRRLGA